MSLTDKIKEALSFAQEKSPNDKKSNQKKKSNHKKRGIYELFGIKVPEDEPKEKEEEIDEKKAKMPTIILPIAPHRMTKLMLYIDSLLAATADSHPGHGSSSSSGHQQSSSDYDVINELWHYLSRELQAPNKSSKVKKLMQLTTTSPPTTSITVATAHKLRCMNLIDGLLHKYPSFRRLVSTDMGLIAKSAGLMKNQNLSNEVIAKGEYVDYVLERIALWDMLYGDKIEGFRMIKRYLKEIVKANVPDLLEQARRHQKEQELQIKTTRNILLHQGEHILKSGTFKALRSDVDKEINLIEEYFQILFPTFENIIPLKAQESKKSNPVIDSKAATDENTSDDIEWDDVEWVSSNNKDETKGAAEYDDEVEDEGFLDFDLDYLPQAVPRTIEFELKTTIADVQNEENQEIVASIKELATHLVNHSLPKLKAWNELFTKISQVQEEMIAEASSKPSAGSSSSSSSSSSSGNGHQLRQSLQQSQQALILINASIEGINHIIQERCKELFSN